MDLDTLLRDTASVPDPSPHDLAAGRDALDAATMTSARRVTAVRVARRRRTRRLGLVAIFAAAASLVLVIGPTVDLGDSPPAATANAAQVLFRAGAAAGAQPGGWPDAAYWHSVSSYRQGSGASHLREIWIGHHAIGVLKDPGVNSGIIPLEVALFGPALSWDQLYALPTESRALERELRARINGTGGDDDSALFGIVGDLLRESPAGPALRQALWEVAARVPGVTLVGAVKDSTGRSGVAVERGDRRYVLDPKDGRLLEEFEGNSQPVPEAPGGTNWRGTYLQQGPADSAPAPTGFGPKQRNG